MTLDKDAFADNHIRFIAGKPKTLKVIAVRQETQTINDKPVESIVFGVTEEDGKVVEKELSITSKRLVNAIWKVAEQVEAGKTTTFKITKFGTSFETYYEFCEVVDGKDGTVISTEQK